MQVPLCVVLLERLGRRARSRLSCSNRALQYKYRLMFTQGATGSLKHRHHFFSVCDHWQLKQQKEEQHVAGKWMYAASSHVLFQVTTAFCQRQEASGIMRWQDQEEADSESAMLGFKIG